MMLRRLTRIAFIERAITRTSDTFDVLPPCLRQSAHYPSMAMGRQEALQAWTVGQAATQCRIIAAQLAVEGAKMAPFEREQDADAYACGCQDQEIGWEFSLLVLRSLDGRSDDQASHGVCYDIYRIPKARERFPDLVGKVFAEIDVSLLWGGLFKSQLTSFA